MDAIISITQGKFNGRNNRKNREELLKIIQSYTDLAQADQEALADNFSQYDFEIQDVFLEALRCGKDFKNQ